MKTTSRCFVPLCLRFRSLLAPLLIGTTCPSNAAVVDAFLAAPASLSYPGKSLDVQSLESGLFETRRLSLGYGDQTLTVAGGILDYRLDVPADTASGNRRGYFSMSYETSEPLDLIASGFTSIRVTFEMFSAEPASLLKLSLETGPYTSDSVSIGDLLSGPVDSTTVVDVPISMFDRIDPTGIRKLEIYAGRLMWPAEIRISSIELVPEPGTCGMLAASGALLMLRRRRGVA